MTDRVVTLTDASQRRDVATIRKLLRDEVTIGGLWFDEVACMTRFAAPARVTGPALDELARCLAALELAPSPRKDELPDVAVLTSKPGIELEARFVETRQGSWLSWIGYAGRQDLADALPSVSAATLETLRVAGDPQAPLAGPGMFDELTTLKAAYAWLKVCIDSTGAVTGAHVREASSPRAARVFADATQTWKFMPFRLRSGPPASRVTTRSSSRTRAGGCSVPTSTKGARSRCAAPRSSSTHSVSARRPSCRR